MAPFTINELFLRRVDLISDILQINENMTNIHRQMCDIVESCLSVASPRVQLNWGSLRALKLKLGRNQDREIEILWNLQACELRLAAYRDFWQDRVSGLVETTRFRVFEGKKVGWNPDEDEAWAKYYSNLELYKRLNMISSPLEQNISPMPFRYEPGSAGIAEEDSDGDRYSTDSFHEDMFMNQVGMNTSFIPGTVKRLQRRATFHAYSHTDDQRMRDELQSIAESTAKLAHALARRSVTER